MSEATCPTCRRHRSVVGVEQGGYDGVLFWWCSACDVAFPRAFLDPRLAARSQDAAEAENDRAAQRAGQATEVARAFAAVRSSAVDLGGTAAAGVVTGADTEGRGGSGAIGGDAP